MLDWQKDLLFTREPCTHNSLIRNIEEAPKSEKQFRELCSLLFDVHLIEHPLMTPPRFPKASEFDSDTLPAGLGSYCNFLFHTRHYKHPKELGKGFQGGNVSTSSFINTLTKNVTPGMANNLSFLIGGIGAGKSTLCSNIILKRGLSWLENDNLLVVRIDMDNAMHHLPPKLGFEKKDFLFRIYDRIHKAYVETGAVTEEERDEIVAQVPIKRESSETYQAETRLCSLYRKLFEASHGKRLLLIIDNIDFLYHYYDRGLFIHEAEIKPEKRTETQNRLEEERTRAHLMVQYLIEAFFHDKYALRQFGANILIVLRNDSLEHYLAGEPETEHHNPLDRTFRLIKQDPIQVTRAHMNHLKDIVKEWPAERIRKAYSQAAETIDPTIERKGERGHQRRKGTLLTN